MGLFKKKKKTQEEIHISIQEKGEKTYLVFNIKDADKLYDYCREYVTKIRSETITDDVITFFEKKKLEFAHLSPDLIINLDTDEFVNNRPDLLQTNPLNIAMIEDKDESEEEMVISPKELKKRRKKQLKEAKRRLEKAMDENGGNIEDGDYLGKNSIVYIIAKKLCYNADDTEELNELLEEIRNMLAKEYISMTINGTTYFSKKK